MSDNEKIGKPSIWAWSPDDDLEWSLETVSEAIGEIGMGDRHVTREDAQEAWETVKERLNQAKQDVEFYKRHYEEELPIKECYCEDCVEIRVDEEFS